MIKMVRKITRRKNEPRESFWKRAVKAKEKIAETSQTEIRIIISNKKRVAVVYQKILKKKGPPIKKTQGI